MMKTGEDVARERWKKLAKRLWRQRAHAMKRAVDYAKALAVADAALGLAVLKGNVEDQAADTLDADLAALVWQWQQRAATYQKAGRTYDAERIAECVADLAKVATLFPAPRVTDPKAETIPPPPLRVPTPFQCGRCGATAQVGADLLCHACATFVHGRDH